MDTDHLPEQYVTRPGTPMIGPYSTTRWMTSTRHWAVAKPNRQA